MHVAGGKLHVRRGIAMNRLEKKHRRPTRWCHWTNVVFLSGMISSGLLIYWVKDVYRVGLGGFTRSFHLEHRLAEGMAWHFFFMWLFAANGIIYVLYTIFSGEWR
jgi:thiosulfate reductase cytochrome b subunit